MRGRCGGLRRHSVRDFLPEAVTDSFLVERMVEDSVADIIVAPWYYCRWRGEGPIAVAATSTPPGAGPSFSAVYGAKIFCAYQHAKFATFGSSSVQ